MNIYALIPVITFFVTLCTGTYIYAQKRNSPVNSSYLLLAGSHLAYEAMTFTLWLPVSLGMIPFFIRLSYVFLFLQGYLFFNFTYLFVQHRRDRWYYLFLSLIVIAIGLVFVDSLIYVGYKETFWGIFPLPGILNGPAILIALVVPVSYGFILIFLKSRSVVDIYYKRQLLLILQGSSLALVFGVLLGVFIPLVFGYNKLVPLGFLALSIHTIYVCIAVYRYNFLTVDLLQIEKAFHHLFENTKDGIIVLDQKNTVQQINRTAQEYFGVREFFPGALPVKKVVPEFDATRLYHNHEIYLLSPAERVLLLSQSNLKYAEGINWKLLIFRDATELKRSERDLKRSEQQIRDQNRYNRLRAEIWKTANEADLTEEQLIQKLLHTIGPVLEVSRACYNRLVNEQFVCEIEWCREGIAPSIGMRISYRIVKHFLKNEFQVYDYELAVKKLPRLMKPVAEPVLKAFARQLGLVSLAFIPYYINDDIEGIITFDICHQQKERPAWTEEKKHVVQDLVQIITQSITKKRMEQAVREAKDDLEKRVAERTAELETLNQKLVNEINERTQAEAKIAGSLKEKEVLLKEIHHRVKNNLQTISSLLSLQSRHVQGRESRELFRDCQSRIRSISIIHERLYKSPDLANIDFPDYVRKLVQELYLMHTIDRDAVGLDLKLENVSLSLDKAIPCGLIINELVSNALKHAFPDGKKGTVTVGLHPAGPERIQLTIQDDGIGLPADVDFTTTGSLGLQLVKTLVDQVEGDAQFIREGGTRCQVTLKNN